MVQSRRCSQPAKNLLLRAYWSSSPAKVIPVRLTPPMHAVASGPAPPLRAAASGGSSPLRVQP
ncbi:SusC/RagA family TonB-linked outer membrane protein [Sesbania bispinosa]|nr:SusC/RagA family TonB-linked outer membrane protein [Sesbania bispinosa]